MCEGFFLSNFVLEFGRLNKFSSLVFIGSSVGKFMSISDAYRLD